MKKHTTTNSTSIHETFFPPVTRGVVAETAEPGPRRRHHPLTSLFYSHSDSTSKTGTSSLASKRVSVVPPKTQFVVVSDKSPAKLPPVPSFHDRTSFYTKTPLPQLLESLEAIMASLKQVYVSSVSTQSMVGKVYSRRGSSKFHVNLFAGDSNRILVECQRRSGDHSTFYEFHRRVLSSAQERGLVQLNVDGQKWRNDHPGCTQLGAASTHVQPPVDCRPAKQVIEQTMLAFDPLFAMCKSVYIDVSRQAAQALAGMAHSDSTVGALAGHKDSAPILCLMLGHTDSEMRRCGATIVNVLAASDLAGAQEVAARCTTHLLSAFTREAARTDKCRSSSSGTAVAPTWPEMRRQAASAFCSLAKRVAPSQELQTGLPKLAALLSPQEDATVLARMNTACQLLTAR